MCNRLHDDFEKIPLEGKAYKLARTSVSHLQGWTSLTGSRLYYASGGGWIKWTPRFSRPEEPGLLGFCFMPTLEEAHDVRALWDGGIVLQVFDTKILEVDYRQGLGRFMESHFISGHSVRIMLAREFKIIRTI